ncbi:DUF1574 family protein [Leptospira wolffii]|uniref:DUF1574 family protein n=1 Tax=Leptospira wolffii TaxID=409998 RepID=UPI0002F5EF74|nr:DUF1574 family protein [Leptospira wolffii]EPG67082.1 PF07611 family protein [Leptospira wolffii serovar Khorat str. Khorat-H2]
MDLFRNKVLLYPIFLGFGVWSVLRLLATSPVLALTVPYSNIERIVFDSKILIFQDLEKNILSKEPKPYGIVFGTSKSSAFEPEKVRKVIGEKDLLLYSFNVPMGCPSYYYYWWEKIEALSYKTRKYPKFIILESDVFQFGEQSVRFTLDNSYDSGFILRGFWNRLLDLSRPGWNFEETVFYFSRVIFPIYSYTISTKGISENWKYFDTSEGKKERAVFLKEKFRKEFLDRTLALGGSYPNLYLGDTSYQALHRQTEEGISRYFLGYKALDGQQKYYKSLLDSFAEKKIPTIVYWPIFPDRFAKELDKLSHISQTKKALLEIVWETGRENPDWKWRIADPQEENRVSCRAFSDVYHLSGGCFPELTVYLLEKEVLEK